MPTLEELRTNAVWGGRFFRSAPSAGVDMVRLAIDSRFSRQDVEPRILVGTHHKVLSVFMRRVFRSFSAITARSFATGKGGEIPEGCDVFHAHHSQADMTKISGNWVGLHVRRDPRDLLVSATLYHLRSQSGEAWLHIPRPEFDGATYQEKLRSLPTMEMQLLFEIERSGGNNIQDMLNWNDAYPGIAELRYEEMIGPHAEDIFRAALANWPITELESKVLLELYRFFSLSGSGLRKDHVRNPSAGQWKRHFTPRVATAFETRFPGAAARLGYQEIVSEQVEH